MSEGFEAGRLYLALDTSGPTGHVAVGEGGRVLARARLETQGQHAARLVAAMDGVLAEASVDREELAGVVVGEGPGSFTGVRVAAATAKGVARALGLPLWAVSSLAAAAVSDLVSGARSAVRYALFDARAERVYGACYGVGRRGVETLRPPHADELRHLLAGDVPDGVVFTGDGAERHRALIEGAGYTVEPAPAGEPTGDALLHVMALHADTPPVSDLAAWEPRYVKASNAEREWVG